MIKHLPGECQFKLSRTPGGAILYGADVALVAMDQDDDCVFCKLLSGELEVSFVHQDDVCSAFMDIQPVNPGHVLVVPNRHATHLADLKQEEGAQVFHVARQV